MKEHTPKRILFFLNDFKTHQWGKELKKYNYEVVSTGNRFFSHLGILTSGFFKKKPIEAFIFRYLYDSVSLYESSLYLIRDILIVLLCKLLRVKIFWILHNIDRETQQYYPVLIRLRRKIISAASNRIFVTDTHLIEVARNHGFKQKKIDWLCFGKPERQMPDQKNISLNKQISAFREFLREDVNSNICLGLCVSEPAKKKTHYLNADSIVGKSTKTDRTCVGLIMIGNYPEGAEFERAKRRALESPYILLIEDTFSVNESLIAENIDFFYRSLSDQSVAYTLYVAADVKKPVFTHQKGALPLLIEKESLGFTIHNNETDIPGFINKSVSLWKPDGAEHFLESRTWEIGAARFIQALKNYDT